MNETMTGEVLRQLRIERGYTQNELAKYLRVSRSLVSKIETGQREASPELTKRIIELFESVDQSDSLEGIVDYLTIHFFDTDYQKIIDNVLKINLKYMDFHESTMLNYDGYFNFRTSIYIRISKNQTQGTLIEIKGQGCRLLSGQLKCAGKTWQDFFQVVHDFRGNFTRIDLALNDRFGLLDIPTLIRKIKRLEFKTTFRIVDPREAFNTSDGTSRGATIYFGSFRSLSHFCFYQKDYEQFVKRGTPMGDAEIINRYELRYRDKKADKLAQQITRGANLNSLIIGLISQSVTFFDRPRDQEGVQIDQRWQAFISGNEKIKLQLESQQMTLEKTIRWFEESVAPSLKLVRELGEFFHFDVIEAVIETGKLSEGTEKLKEHIFDYPDLYQGEFNFYKQYFREKQIKQSTADNNV